MRKILFLSFFLAIFGSVISSVSAQTEAAVKPSLISGDVTSISAEKISLQTANGAADFALSDKTVYKRVPAENPKTQVDSSFSEIAVGDKVVVSVIFGADKKAQPVRTVYLMSKADISQRQAKELQEWRTRGVSGKITAVNPQTKEITVTIPSLMGAKTTILTPKDSAQFLRYAQDSVSFSEAKKSSFTEIAVGDSIRALGDKSEDGATFKAEKIVTGAFQTVVGTITAVNAEKGEITINNIQTKKDMTIVVDKNSLLKQFPADVAQRMAQAQMMQANGGGNMIRPPQGAQQGNQNPQQNPNQMQGGGGNRGGGSLDEMLERFPTIAVADLKVGEMIAVNSSKTPNQERITAIKLVSGVEPFTKVPQMANGGGNRQGGGGVNSSFTIPGLDGN
jgi:ribosomal protein L24